MSTSMIKPIAACLALCVAGLTACEGVEVKEAKPRITEQKDKIREQSGTIHGEDGFVLYSDREGGEAREETAAVGASGDTPPAQGQQGSANPFLWQASLESLDFLPLSQADRSGGVIISDWYAPPETPDERFKVTVYILDPTLRADALKVAVFRQTQGDGGWVDAAVDETTAAGLEDNILRRARELRLVNTGEG